LFVERVSTIKKYDPHSSARNEISMERTVYGIAAVSKSSLI
jgi:hypothetical protein